MDIAWGGMSFTYVEGTWNANTHSYTDGHWIDGGTGYVTIANSGTQDTTAALSFESNRTEIAGSFTDGQSTIQSNLPIPIGQSRTAYLILSGKPEAELDNEIIGAITVKIGGDKHEAES